MLFFCYLRSVLMVKLNEKSKLALIEELMPYQKELRRWRLPNYVKIIDKILYNYVLDWDPFWMVEIKQILYREMNSNGPTFEHLEALIEGALLSQDIQRTPILAGVQAIISKLASKFSAISKQFSQKLLQTRHVHLNHDYLCDNLQGIKFLICKNNKAYQFKGAEYRGVVISGKAVNVYMRKKTIDTSELQHRDQFCSLVEQGVIRLFEDGNLILSKAQKDYPLNDILLSHDMPDAKTDEVLMGNQIFSPFVPIEKSIVMLVPFKVLKPECLDFIKSSILHPYVDEVQLLSKIIQKQNFYKNSVLRGLYFVDEGEVEVPSGRIIARGWTCFGKCKIAGVGWKFKPIPFIRFLTKNPSLWKQFINDIKLNSEYPFSIIHILGLNEEDDFTNSAEWKSLGKRKFGNKLTKLPKLAQMQSRSVDQQKFMEIERLRHYDERLDDVFSYKQDLLTRKLKGLVHGKFQPIFRSQEAEKKLEQKKKMIDRLNSRKSQILNKKHSHSDLSSSNQPGENVLIISVLKRLESIADLQQNQTERDTMYNGKKDKSPELSGYHHLGGSDRKGNVKITPMQLYERTKILKKQNNRYSKFEIGR